MPVAEFAAKFFRVAPPIPRFQFTLVFLDYTDAVHELSAPDVIVDQMFSGSPPHRRDRRDQIFGEPFRWNEGPPGDVSRIVRRTTAE